MTRGQLGQVLANSGLFTFAEEQLIMRTCGRFTIGNAIIVCELLKIKLTGNDVDVLLSTLSTTKERGEC